MDILNDDPALPKYNRILRNISAGGKWIEFHNKETEPLVYFQDNKKDVDLTLLINDEDDIQIQYDAITLPPGFQPIPIKKIGLSR
jgi:hypothetical protein